jgi:hypothetical protein
MVENRHHNNNEKERNRERGLALSIFFLFKKKNFFSPLLFGFPQRTKVGHELTSHHHRPVELSSNRPFMYMRHNL